jgi:predicted Zn-dependent peptidase
MRRTTSRTLEQSEDGSVVRRTTLSNGLRIVTEKVPGVRSVAVGAWVGVGSRDETARQLGSAHFLEHLLFKGTKRRSAWEISSAIEAVGGEMNAFTTKEYTCYYARVLDRDIGLAIDVVCDLVSEGLLDSADIESERAVILEEIAMTDDDAADGVHDLAMSTHFGDGPLGRPILGTIPSIAALSPRGIRSFYRNRYVPDTMVIAVAGNVDHDMVVRLIRKSVRHLDERHEGSAPPSVSVRPRSRVKPAAVAVKNRRTEQVNVVLSHTGLSRFDDRRYALAVLNAALGGGMSSRLFQTIREQRGLAYSVYSFSTHFADTGLVGVYAGCLPSKVDQVVSLAREVLLDVADSGLADEELLRGRGQITGAMVLGQEDTGSRMSRIGKAELLYGEIPSVTETLARVDAVTGEQVQAIAADLLAARPTLSVVGPVREAQMERLAANL